MDYLFSLYDLERAAPNHIKETELLFMSADQFPTCLQSSGIFCYFELQACHARLGRQAMRFLGLPENERVVTEAWTLLGLSADASEAEIGQITRDWVGQGLEGLLEKLDVIEQQWYQSNECVDAAITEYVRENSAELYHTLNSGNYGQI
ncbi:hypothetical protein [Tropicibacter sp. S64]|uniref:hypothetical protein n=1 Tax=Tropicibacter sp. S64 TaxID=3415122 RepID=UPI003C79F39D